MGFRLSSFSGRFRGERHLPQISSLRTLFVRVFDVSKPLKSDFPLRTIHFWRSRSVASQTRVPIQKELVLPFIPNLLLYILFVQLFLLQYLEEKYLLQLFNNSYFTCRLTRAAVHSLKFNCKTNLDVKYHQVLQEKYLNFALQSIRIIRIFSRFFY